ncbi:MAG: molybdopterin biosynthesis protein [Nitrospirae bacterium]|nr:molybdopterin biosynthesis protein [Nitrospirota bacterium]
MAKRKIYLENIPLAEALERWWKKLKEAGLDKPLAGERIPVDNSLGRVTAEAVSAKISSPFYHASAMDGYAVRFADTFGASETKPKRLRIGKESVYVDTGDPMPEGFDAVIMIEDVNIITPSLTLPPHRPRSAKRGGRGGGQGWGEEFIEIIEPATPWQHVRTIGEDIVATELILPENHIIRPVDIGALLGGGITEIVVRRKPKVVIIPTGTELVEPGAELKKGNIIEYNSRILGGMVEEWGGEAIRIKPVPDDYDAIRKAILEAIEIGDIVVINAGASLGSEDFTASIIEDIGEVIIHGVAIRPGKPVILGLMNKKPVVGIPGYPVSAFLTFRLFVKPLIYTCQGRTVPPEERIEAKLSRQVASPLGQEEFLRVKLGEVGGKLIATPVSRGAGVLMSLVRADGIVRISAQSEGLAAGSEIEVELLRQKADILNTIVCIGSHDNTLDLLANYLKKRYPEMSLSSAHVGSMGGLMALKRGEAHLAGTHLLDEETGEYNIPFLKRLLTEKKIVLVNLVYREQGLLVLRGNPKGIEGFEDLQRDDVIFINRQAGAGTRLLTDKSLKELGIELREVKGYDHEEYTHMGVASAVLSGIADTGLAILSSAVALDLDFIPVAKERYDLAIPEEFYNSEMIKRLLDIIRDDEEFRSHVLALGGYDISDMGKVIYKG